MADGLISGAHPCAAGIRAGITERVGQLRRARGASLRHVGERKHLPRGDRVFPAHAERCEDRRGGLVIESEYAEVALPELDRLRDPRGGAVAWALLVVGAALVVGILLAVIWTAGAAW